MVKFYVRPLEFSYGSDAKRSVKQKLAKKLCGRNDISFSKLEIIKRDNEEIQKLQSNKLESQKLLKDTSFWKKGSIEESIKFNQNRVNQLSDQIKENTQKLAQAKKIVEIYLQNSHFLHL